MYSFGYKLTIANKEGATTCNGVVPFLLQNNNNKNMKQEEIITGILSHKDDTEFMDTLNAISFPYTSKYRKYTKTESEVNEEETTFGSFE